MANDIIDINVYETVESVAITVNPNLTTVNINKVTGGGGGGGGETNLTTSQTANDFTINSDTGTDAVVPLGNGTLAGATLNDYTTAEKIKLGKYPSTATNGKILQGNGTNYVEIDTPTGTTNLGYTPAPTNGTVTSSTGTSATIPLADSTNAGLLTAAEKTKIANSVPYTGATGNVNLGEFGIQLGNLEFDNTATNIPTAAGSMYYNDSDGTLDLILKGGNVKLQIGQESVVRVVNKTSTNIDLLEANYQAVRVTGAQGQRLKVDLAQATNDLLSAETIGLVTETITNNQEGFITTSGLVRNINTTGSLQSETWLDGDVLYLSPTIAGSITKVKPIAPNHLVIIGYVISAHATQGTIFVKVDNGYELDELHNVKIDTATNNEVLAYTSATDIWENKTPSEAGLQPTITLTTTGTSGASTLVGATLNIPQYSGATNLGYTPSPTNGTVTSSTGSSATLPLADATNAGLLKPAKFTVLENTSGTNTGDQDLSSLAPKASPTFTGTVVLPSTTSIGNVSSTEIGYLDNVTSSIQTQLDNKIAKNVATTYTTNIITTVTAAEYAAIGTKDATTLYFVI